MNIKFRFDKIEIEWDDGTTIKLEKKEFEQLASWAADSSRVIAALGPIVGQQAIGKPARIEFAKSWKQRPEDPAPVFGESDEAYLARVRRLRRHKAALKRAGRQGKTNGGSSPHS